MKKIFTLKLNHMLKKTIVSATMLGIVFFALASSGGGKKKASSNLGVIPISAKGNFSSNDKKPAYAGSYLLNSMNTRNSTVYTSIVSYQRGNTTYLIPSKFKLTNGNAKVCFKSNGLSLKSNLNVVDLKIRLCK